jgi:hypothetical protein
MNCLILAEVRSANLISAVALCLTLVSGAAFAESASEAMTTFGLVGTWSTDCLDKKLYRVTFQTSFWGPPVMIRKLPSLSGEAPDVRESKVSSAVRVTNDKIRFRSVNPPPGSEWEEVVQKFGDKVRWMDSRTTDGKKILFKNGAFCDRPKGSAEPLAQCDSTHGETPLLERCLSE